MTIKEKIAKKKKRLEMYETAERAVLSGAQSYTLGTRALTRANLSEIRSMIEKLEREVDTLEKQAAGKKPRKAFAVIPRDF